MKHSLLSFFLFVIVVAFIQCKGEYQYFTNKIDVGNPKFSGSLKYDNSTGIYTITGGGVNIWERSDEFFYVWKKESGDFTLSAIISFENGEGNEHKKIGLMIRESLDSNAKYADIAIHADGLTSLQYRAETGGITDEIKTSLNAPEQVVLIRKGNKIIIRGGNKNIVPLNDNAEIEINFPNEFYIGMFICSHEDEKVETAYFSHVKFSKL